MTFYVTDQNIVVASQFVLGVFLGIIYDLFVIKRTLIKTGRVLLALEDLLFCLISGVAFFITDFITNYGYCRWYEIAGCAIGFTVYRGTAGRPIRRISVYIVKFLAKLVYKPISIIARKTVFLGAMLVKKSRRIIFEKKLAAYSEKNIRDFLKASVHGYR